MRIRVEDTHAAGAGLVSTLLAAYLYDPDLVLQRLPTHFTERRNERKSHCRSTLLELATHATSLFPRDPC